jgi:hypothetical protein
MILQNLDNNFYVEIISYHDYRTLLKEEILQKDDIIIDGDNYNDVIETKKSLSSNLKALAAYIRDFDFVKSSSPNPSDAHRGLSAYVNVIFNHPDNITKEEQDKYYKYVIRFSDHEDKHPKSSVTSNIGIVGMKVKNLTKSGKRNFHNKLPEIAKNIHDFEIKKFGKPVTKIDLDNH